MGKLRLKTGCSFYKEGEEGIVGVAFQIFNVSNGFEEVLYGRRFAEVVSIEGFEGEGVYSVRCGLDVIVEKFAEDFEPLVVEVECDDLVVENLRNLGVADEYKGEFYSISFVSIDNEVKSELNTEALRANRNLRGRDETHTDELVETNLQT